MKKLYLVGILGEEEIKEVHEIMKVSFVSWRAQELSQGVKHE